MYTTNYITSTIEAFHRQLHKATKIESSFTFDMALIKLLYLAKREVTAQWKESMHNWNRILAEALIIYDDRLYLDLEMEMYSSPCAAVLPVSR